MHRNNMKHRMLWAGILMVVAVSLHGTPLYRLPVDHREKALDTIAGTFGAALDSVFLRMGYDVIRPGSPDDFHPDSLVCKGSVQRQRGAKLRYTFTVYHFSADSVTGGSFSGIDSLFSHRQLVDSIVYILSRQGYDDRFVSRLQIQGSRGAAVIIDGVLSGAVPFEQFLQPGSYDVTVRGTWYLGSAIDLSLGGGRDTTLQVDFWKMTRPLRYGLIIGGVLAAGSAAWCHAAADRRYEAYTGAASSFDRRYNRYRTAVIWRNVLLCASGISLGSAFYISFTIPFS